MKRIAYALVYGIAGYALGAFAGYWLVMASSGNTHDRQMEATMTSALVIGPLCAVVSAVVGAVRNGPSGRLSQPKN